MKKFSLLLVFTALLGVSIFVNIPSTTASASHVVKYVPAKYRHKWGTWDADWIKFTKHSMSTGYLSNRSVYAGVGFSRIYSKNHIRVYADNMPVNDLKLKFIKNKFYQDKKKHWYLYVHVLGDKGTQMYRRW